ncbi:hypothetical protein COOONC_12695 [Cooperia oncophora]
MTKASQVIYDPGAPLPKADDSNQLVILPGKKRKVHDDGPLPKKKSATGGKKGKNFAKEKEKQKVTKKMKRQLAAVQQRKANKLTQEELFASLAEYQLDSKKLSQLASSSHMQDKMKSAHTSNDDDVDSFPSRIKVCSSKVKLPATIHQKERVQENYYPTDDEDSDGSEDDDNEVVVCDETPSSSSTQLATSGNRRLVCHLAQKNPAHVRRPIMKVLRFPHSAHTSNDDDVDSFPSRIKVCSSKVKLPATIHQKERVQENYYPTDDEDSDGSEDDDNEVVVRS